MTQDINNWYDLRFLRQALLLFCWHKCPQLVYVDDRAPLQIAREVESAHTDFTEVSRMVFVEVGSKLHREVLVGLQENDSDPGRRTGGDADHQQDHDLQGACGAFRHVRDRPIRGHGACESWIGGSAFSVINNNRLSVSACHP